MHRCKAGRDIETFAFHLCLNAASTASASTGFVSKCARVFIGKRVIALRGASLYKLCLEDCVIKVRIVIYGIIPCTSRGRLYRSLSDFFVPGKLDSAIVNGHAVFLFFKLSHDGREENRNL